MESNRGMKSWNFKIARAISIALSVASTAALIYEIGYSAGSDAGEPVVSDFDFYHRLNRLHLGITIGLIVTAVGVLMNKMRGFLLSSLGLIWVGVVYLFWYMQTQAYLRNSEVTEYTRLHDPYYRRLIFNGAGWWDVTVLVLAFLLLVWIALTVFRTWQAGRAP
jgi:hypothetical protein